MIRYIPNKYQFRFSFFLPVAAVSVKHRVDFREDLGNSSAEKTT